MYERDLKTSPQNENDEVVVSYRQWIAEVLSIERQVTSDLNSQLVDLLDSLQVLEVEASLSEIGVSVESDVSLDQLAPVWKAATGSVPSDSGPMADIPDVGPSAAAEDSGGALLKARPSLRGRRSYLTPVVPEMHRWLYELAISEAVGFRWRFRGTIPPFEVFVRELWNGVLTQFVSVSARDGSPQGLVVAYNQDFVQGFAYVGAVFSPSVTGTGVAIEAVGLFTEYLFGTWPFRKLYLEMPEFNYSQIASGAGSYFEVEGRLRNNDFYAGRYWDKLILAVYPERSPQP